MPMNEASAPEPNKFRKRASLFSKQATMTAKCFIALGLALLAGVRAEAEARPPNILFILTEDQGAQMGFVGTPGLQTPHMDSLARSGVYFNNAFVVYPVCSPSKAAIYTGLHNHANGILNNTPNYHKPADQHLICREKLTPPWRQVQADSKDWKPWGNRTYAETVRVKERFPEAYRILAEMDPQSLGGKVPALELYDLKSDPDEMRNLAGTPAARPHRDRLYAALCRWVTETADPAVQPPPFPKE